MDRYFIRPVFSVDYGHRSYTGSLRLAHARADGLRSHGVACLVIDVQTGAAVDRDGAEHVDSASGYPALLPSNGVV